MSYARVRVGLWDVEVDAEVERRPRSESDKLGACLAKNKNGSRKHQKASVLEAHMRKSWVVGV